MKIYKSTWFFEVFLDAETARICTGHGNKTLDGETFEALGDRFTPPKRIRREASLKSQRITLGFDSSRQRDDGNDPIADLLDAQWRRRQVRLRHVLTEPGQTYDEGDVIADERGRLRDMSDDLAVDDPARIDLQIESGALAYLERRMQTRTPANQRAVFPDDEGFDLTARQSGMAQYLNGKRVQSYGAFGPRSGQDVADADSPAPRELLLGKFGVEGTFVLSNTYGENDNGNAIFQQVVALSDCQIEELTAVYMDGVKQNAAPLLHGVRTELKAGDLWEDGARGKQLWATFFDGRYNQTAPSPAFQNDIWRDNRVLKGVAYVIVEIYDGDGSAEMPSLWFTGKGAKLYDRRKDTTAGGSGPHRLSDPTTWEYSGNPMVALDHYRAGRVITPSSSAMWFGVGEVLSAVPYSEFEDMADYCDELVTLKDGVTTQKRFEIGGSLSAADDHKKNLEKMALHMGARVIDQGGRMAVRDSRERTPVLTVTDADLLSDASTVASPAGRYDDLANTIEGRYRDEANLFKKTDYPRVTNEDYIDEDGDEITDTRDFDLETNGERAQRLAKLELAYVRRIFELEEQFPLDFVKPLAPGEWYTRESDARGFPEGKLFEVDRIEKREDGTALVVGLEVDPTALAWTASEASDLHAPPAYSPITLPDVEAPTVSISAVELSANGVVTPGVTFDVTQPAAYVTRIAELSEVEFGAWGGSEFTGATQKYMFDPEDEDGFTLAGFLPDTLYGFRFRGRAGRRVGDWSDVQTVTTTENSTSGTASVMLWSNISGTGKPDDNADVTGDNTAAAIAGQGALALLDTISSADIAEPIGGNYLPVAYRIFESATYPSLTLVNHATGATGVLNKYTGGAAFKVNATTGSTHEVRLTDGNEYNLFLPGGKRYLVRAEAWVQSTALHPDREWRVFLEAEDGDRFFAQTETASGAFIFEFDLTAEPDARYWLAYRQTGLTPGMQDQDSGFWQVATGIFLKASDDMTVPQPSSADWHDALKLVGIEDGADVTASNTAAAIEGQGALALLDALAYGSGYLTNFGALAGLANVYFGSPNLLESDGGDQATLSNFKTVLGTAAGIIDQGAFALFDTADFATYITGRVATAVTYTGGATVDSLMPGESGADVTASNTAAAIVDQGIFATLDEVSTALADANNLLRFVSGGLFTGDLAADVTGDNTAAAIEGQTYFATAASVSLASAYITGKTADNISYIAGGTVDSLKPAEAGADETSSNTAAAIEGQGAGATADSLADLDGSAHTKLGGIEALATVGALIGTNFRYDGGALVDQADIKTSEGTAAAIAGQGWGATASEAAAANAQQIWADISGTGKPDDNADVTGDNTAAAIAGQGVGATADTLADLDGSAAERLARISLIDLTRYPEDFTDSFSGAPEAVSDSNGGWFVNSLSRLEIAADGGFDYIMTKYRIPVHEGQLVRARVEWRFKTLPSAALGTDAVSLFFRSQTASGAYIALEGGVTDHVPASTAWQQLETEYTVEAGQNIAFLRPGFYSRNDITDGVLEVRYFATEVVNQKLVGIEDGADVTASNTAAAIEGQGAGATADSLADLDGSAHTKLGGIEALATVGALIGTNFRYDGGALVDQADIKTSEGTAAAIAGQGWGATASEAAAANAQQIWADISGTGKPDDNADVTGDNTAAAIAGQGYFATAANVSLASAYITNKSLANLDSSANTKLGSIEAGADVTGDHVAASVVGQGALATRSSLDYTDPELTGFGVIATLTQIQLNTSYIVRADGTTMLTETLVITSVGVAAAISGQGGNATTSTYYQGTAPSSPTNGDFWADTTAGELKFRNAGVWEKIADITPVSSGPPTGSAVTGADDTTGNDTANTTWATFAEVDMTVGAEGFLSVPTASLSSSGTTALVGTSHFYGEWRIIELPQAGGSSTVVAGGTFEAEDTGGGFIDIVNSTLPPSVFKAAAEGGDVRYQFQARRASGSGNITDLLCFFAISWTPQG